MRGASMCPSPASKSCTTLSDRGLDAFPRHRAGRLGWRAAEGVRADTMRDAAALAGKSEILDRYAADYPQGPARSAAIDVPGVRIAARRPAHAPHRDRALGLGLLRLRPDLHVTFLRRQPQRRLCALQLGDARHGQAVRGHPGSGRGARRSRRSTTRSSSPICACRPLRACRCSCCPTRSTASA